MTVYKHQRSRYWHYDFQIDGQRYADSTRCTNKRDAERVEAEARRNIIFGNTAKPQVTIDDAIGTWWANKGQYQRSAKTTRYQLANLVDGLGKSNRVSDVGFAELDDYVALRRKAVSNASVNREIEHARKIWRYTARRKFDVGDDIEWGKLMLPEPKERVRELLADEELRLFAELPEDIAAVAEFAMISGQRRTAVVTLLWRNVDFNNCTAKIKLKAQSDDWHSFPLPPRLIAIIKGRPKVCPQVFTYMCERSAPPRLDRVRRIKGERYPMTPQGWERKWKKALSNAEIEDFRFHDMRHTALTRITRATGNLKIAQKLAGHSTINTTARYAHVTGDDVLAAMVTTESRTIPEPNPHDSAEVSTVTRTYRVVR
ncbi:site-specific integrase [Polymorphobacter arshaanensis]|uniref:Site-specific integrase n=1 Tax=Glacieibacterium arshaanense TaxID=2511025 RepID=A0A4Y9ETE5_9SPHN|nr:site-specific integrase [Polymorphobacter arshaanensis]TFU06188.1 site-specific integrase [Polymorphobacter arshaanensis]